MVSTAGDSALRAYAAQRRHPRRRADIKPKTIQLMATNHLPDGKDLPALSRSLFSEAMFDGIGFGLGFAVVIDPPRTLIPGSQGDFS